MNNQHREANRSNWDERARLHAASSYYDLDGFRSGPRNLSLHPREPGEMGSVEGKRLCHLQCHLGVETLSWARLGAREVVGLDFSSEAIAVARQLARECGLEARARFVEADFHDARSALEGMAPS